MMLVTGGNGHLGYNLVKTLSEAGYRTRTTVRDLRKAWPLRHLPNVEIVEAELLDAVSIQKAMKAIRIVFHTAAPNRLWSSHPEREIVAPIMDGTKNVLYAAHCNRVEKVIFTSSCSACGLNSSKIAPLNESHWNETATHPLLKSKIEAEKWAWNFSLENNLSLVAILPPLIIGPGFHTFTPSTDIFNKMLSGRFISPPEGGCHMVDVRDVAKAHLRAAINSCANGRYIVAGEFLTWSGLIKLINQIEPDLKIPSYQLPSFSLQWLRLLDFVLHKMIGRPRELTGEFIKDFIHQFQYVSTKRAEMDLDWHPRPIKQSIQDTFWWIRNGL